MIENRSFLGIIKKTETPTRHLEGDEGSGSPRGGIVPLYF